LTLDGRKEGWGTGPFGYGGCGVPQPSGGAWGCAPPNKQNIVNDRYWIKLREIGSMNVRPREYDGK